MKAAMNPGYLANNILEHSFKEERPINAMKLQKLTYMTTALYAHFKNEYPLYESFSAWQYGPVLLSLHNYYKCFNGDVLTTYKKDAKGVALTIEDQLTRLIVSQIWETFKDYSHKEIAEVTMVKNSAWMKAFSEGRTLIPEEYVIRDTTFHKFLKSDPSEIFVSSSL